ncbi:putative Mg2+ transporter-C (MgtC) family protein [Sphingopyxis flava]|uniref:Protein MgtC n=2 Tax=Sphingopyxis flava TaxID=1507287 RepID=A0A1T5BMN5_9SPHN|nr:putative Mg2+ transporter-C (MgtC) family protein [Sphingopyxis flava]
MLNNLPTRRFVWDLVCKHASQSVPFPPGEPVAPFLLPAAILWFQRPEPFFFPCAMEAMELNPPTLVHWVDFDLLSRLGVAALLGLFLGLDREIRGHAAGLRTHGLICFSAAMMTVSVLALYGQLGSGDRMDPLRIFEATGGFIGIIGAGLIVFSRGEVHNLTTAAHLWLAAVIGIACGAAQWPLVVIGCFISLVMLTLLRIAERRWEGCEGESGRSPDQK